MSITSYAQNFEDVMLWRALGHIPNGFYIDVGAQHPVIDSVSKAFYEHGWRGIHIEATPVYATLVRADRPDEPVLQVALSDKPGSLTFYEIPDTGLSTGDASIAEHHRARGYNVVETVVPCITLADVFSQVGQQDVHWLKIDVEGMEAQVLAGWGDCHVRPWVLVVESTYPNSQVETHHPWEGMVLARGYVHTYFDGLSRYYVLADRHDLAQKFNTPPNIFDGFSLAPSVPYNGPTRDLIQKQGQKHQNELAGERTNAAQELQTVRETLAQREDALGAHISQLHHQISMAAEQQTAALAAHDAVAAKQIETLSRQHSEEFLRSAAKENELNTSMQQLLQQGEQEKTHLVNMHKQEGQTLRNQHTEREQAIAQQLQTSQEERLRLQQEQIQREQTLLAQTNQAKQEVESLLRTQVQREQAVTEKLEAVRSQAAQGSAELVRSFTEQQHSLQSQHAAREQALGQQIEAARKDGAKREQTLHDQTRQARQELESLLRTQVQREREVLNQLINVHHQASREKNDLVRSHAEELREHAKQQAQREKTQTQQLHIYQQELRLLQKDCLKHEQETAQEKVNLARVAKEQEHALLCQHAERENVHSQHLRNQREEFHYLQIAQSKREHALLEEHGQSLQQLEILQATLVQREQELPAQLQVAQHQAAQETTELLQKQIEQKETLQLQHNEREAAFTQQLQELQQLLQHQQEDWKQLQQALNNEIVTLQNETQTLHQGQQTSRQLHQLLAEMKHNLEMTHSSLSWRMTAPIRKLAELLFNSNKNQALVHVILSRPITPERDMQVATEPPPTTITQASFQSTMLPPAQANSVNMPIIASTLEDLLACNGPQFINCAYRTLLGRAPDFEGEGYYLARLNNGYSKMRIVAELHLSKEGKTRSTHLPGLETAIQRQKKGQYPLIGWLFRKMGDMGGDSPIERKLRIIENKVLLVIDESTQGFSQLNHKLTEMHCSIAQQTQSISALCVQTANTTSVLKSLTAGIHSLIPHQQAQTPSTVQHFASAVSNQNSQEICTEPVATQILSHLKREDNLSYLTIEDLIKISSSDKYIYGSGKKVKNSPPLTIENLLNMSISTQ